MDTSNVVTQALDQFRQGERDAAFFQLVEMNHGIIPELIAAYRKEPMSSIRAFLVEVIWQHRQPETIPLLAEALDDPEPDVWMQALDGLVTLASSESLATLTSRKLRSPANSTIHEWIEEAIEQVQQTLPKR